MDSRVTSRTVTKKELILGHLIGPLGLIFVVNTIAALVEKFFTQQVGAMYGTDNVVAVQVMGAKYEVLMTVTKILGVFVGLLNSWLISHTHTRHGRLRPWYLIFGFLSIAIGFLIFLFPGTTLGENYWYYFFTLVICYNTIGSSYFYLFRDTIVSLTTRVPSEKARLAFVRKVSWTLISGIIIGMLVNSLVLPLWLEKDINGYAILMVTLSAVAIPLLLLEYYYTKERVMDDIALENGLKFYVDWQKGQKTGFFVDQRENRKLLEHYAKGRSVLNMFCYTGGFSFYAMRGGAKLVHSVDSSAKAISLTNRNVELNFPGDPRHEAYAEDAFKYLERMGSNYDLIILDPPAFAKHKDVLRNALQGYRKLNAIAFEKIKPGGILFTFSCSQVVSKENFRLAVFSAAAQSKRNVRILHQLTQPADHPVNIYHPEGEYLKGLVLYVE